MVNAGPLHACCAGLPMMEEKAVFYAVLGYLAQLSMLYLLVAMFILLDLLLLAVRSRRLREEKEQREADRRRSAERRERRRLGERPAIRARVPQPTASLAGIGIGRKQDRPGLRRKTAL